VKLADFGTSALLNGNQSPRTSFVGTQDYVSPEVLSGERKATKASDLWAVGIMIYQMLTGISPFRGATEYLTFEAIMGHCRRTNPLSYPEAVNLISQDIIEHLLKANELERIGSGDDNDSDNGYPKLKEHPFFEGIHWDDLINRLPPFQPDPTKFPDANNMRDGAEDAWLLEGEATPITPYIPQEELTKSRDSTLEINAANKIWSRFLLEGENAVFTSTIYKRKVKELCCNNCFSELLLIVHFRVSFRRNDS
jgi:serine/threonine protein kinase